MNRLRTLAVLVAASAMSSASPALAAAGGAGKSGATLTLDVISADGDSDVVSLAGWGFAKNTAVTMSAGVDLATPLKTDGSGSFIVTAVVHCSKVTSTDSRRNAATAYDLNLPGCS